MEVIDKEWARKRYRDEIDMNLKPLVTGVEWSALYRLGHTDWLKWEKLESNTQWQQMIEAKLIFGRPSGFVDEGGDSDGGERGKQTVRSSRNSLAMPPSTYSSSYQETRRPIEVMPHGYDITRSAGIDGIAQQVQRFPTRPAAPVSAKPPPPEAPPVQRRSLEVVSENQNRSSEEKDIGGEWGKISIEGMNFLGFGQDPSATYDQAWAWVRNSQKTLNEVMKDCSLSDGECLKFMSWFRKKQELTEI